MNKLFYISGLVFAIIGICPFFLMREGHYFVGFFSEICFVYICLSIALISLGRYLGTKKPINLIPVSMFGAMSIIDIINMIYDSAIKTFNISVILIGVNGSKNNSIYNSIVCHNYWGCDFYCSGKSDIPEDEKRS
jgi:hypothetical protein